MNERPWGPWGGHRPPWWPENEPFPPRGAARRHGRPRGRWLALMLLAFLTFVVLIAFIVFVLFQAFTAIAGDAPPLIFVVLASVFVFFALTGGVRGAQRLAAPVRDLVDAADRIATGDYTARVRVRGPREVRGLANAFNTMGERLERSEVERRRLLADVTHELRTPLTVIQGNVEALIDGVHPPDEAHFRAVLDETRVLSRLIDDLRTISVAESGALALHREATDIAALARSVASSFAAQAELQGVRLETDVTLGDATLEVDPIRTREVLANVVANALRYTPAGGSVDLTVTPFEHEVQLTVRDTGPGIAPDVLPHVFERFTKSPESPGAGLGLAIAKSLVTAHGGTIEARSAPGEGTEIRVTLPRTASRAV